MKAWMYLWIEQAQCPLCPHCAQAICETHRQQLPAEAASVKSFRFLLIHSVGTEQITMMLMGFIKGVLLDTDPDKDIAFSVLRILWLNNESLGVLDFFSPPLLLFSYDHIPLQLHISILPLSRSSFLISCPHCSLLPLFPRAVCHHTVKQEQIYGYQCGVTAHHCSTSRTETSRRADSSLLSPSLSLLCGRVIVLPLPFPG